MIQQSSHPLGLMKMIWPRDRMYREQVLTVRSVVDNDETLVVAGNKLGKDYTAGKVAVTFFYSPWSFFPVKRFLELEAQRVRQFGIIDPEDPRFAASVRAVHTRRVVSTSVRESHLDVLWGEIGRFLTTAEVPLLESRGGPFIVNSLDIRFKEDREVKKPYSYLIGCVAGNSGEGLAGHHAAYTLFLGDEVSGLSDTAYDMSLGWRHKSLLWGNPNQCQNFFRRMVKQGDVR